MAVALAGHMQIICTSLQTDNCASPSLLSFFMGRMLFLLPSQQLQSTEGVPFTAEFIGERILKLKVSTVGTDSD